METLPGGASRFRHHHRSPPSAERFLGMLQQPPSSAPAPPLELSEYDIFSTPVECCPPSPTRPISDPNPKHAPNTSLNHYGILAALNRNIRTRSGSESNTRPIFNHKASPASPDTSGIMIPRPPRAQGDRIRFHPRSAPIDIPVIPAALRRRAREMDDVVSEGEDDTNGVILPPHEVVASRHSTMLSCSMTEGAGRTLKGRDLRQVRNAIWRKTGFID